MFSALIDDWAVDWDSATLAIPGVNSKNKLKSYHLSGYQSSILTKGKYQQAKQNKQDNIAQTILVNEFSAQGSLGGSDGCSYTLIKAYYCGTTRQLDCWQRLGRLGILYVLLSVDSKS